MLSGNATQSVVHKSMASASQEKLLEIQILEPGPESESLGEDPSVWAFPSDFSAQQRQLVLRLSSQSSVDAALVLVYWDL